MKNPDNMHVRSLSQAELANTNGGGIVETIISLYWTYMVVTGKINEMF